MTTHASLNTPSNLREIWKQLDQGILPEHLRTTTPSTMSPPSKKINVAIIGYGLSAKIFHIPLILALPNLYALYGIVQRSPKPNDDASHDHAGVQTWRSTDAMLSDPEVDLVIITSTPETHFPLAHAALEAGKHLVVEKPFMPTASEARKISALAKAKNLRVGVYQNRRWDLDFLTLKQLLDEGTLGHVAEFETHYDRFRPEVPATLTWKNKALPAGGALFDLGSHLIDQVYALYGAPRSVSAVVQVQKRGVRMGQVAPDACTVLLRYGGDEEDEKLVTVKSSSISAGEEQLRYWIRGDKGSFKKYHLDPQEDQLKAGLRPGDDGFGREDKSHYATVTTPSSSSSSPFTTKTYPSVEPATYVEYYRIMAKALQGEGEVPVSADEAADVLRVIEMAMESSETGRVVAWEDGSGSGDDGKKATMI